jgi:hypothetical protein
MAKNTDIYPTIKAFQAQVKKSLELGIPLWQVLSIGPLLSTPRVNKADVETIPPTILVALRVYSIPFYTDSPSTAGRLEVRYQKIKADPEIYALIRSQIKII